MYEEIVTEIENGDYEKATELLMNEIDHSLYNDQLAVLAATINEYFGFYEESYEHIIRVWNAIVKIMNCI